jgi:hypothetical protein
MGALPGARHPEAARIIAKTAQSASHGTASHWATPIFGQSFPQDFSRRKVVCGTEFADIRRCGMGIESERMPGKYKSNIANIWLY